MAEEIRDLIERINQDGVKAAEEKAQKIEAAAMKRAEDILDQARREADSMITAARKRISLEEETEKTLLAQAGRDLLLSLRNEINAMLGQVMVSEIRQALTPDALSRILSELISHYDTDQSSDITVLLKKEDAGILESHFLLMLTKETKRNIVLRPSGEISGGFIISFDNGKSCYDFTDRALAEYIGMYLKPKLSRILNDAVRD